MSSRFLSTLPPSAGAAKPGKDLRLLAVLCLGLFGCTLMAEGTSAKVQFKEPGKPGRLVVYVSRGDLRIKAGDTPGEVSVSSSAAKSDKDEVRSDGLRVLSTSEASFTLTANDNVAELNYGKDAWPMEGGNANFEVTVPRNTTLEIQNGWGGEVKVEKITGDVAIKGMNCEIELTDLEGGANIETMNGPITASFASLSAEKPVSISSMNGEVKLRIPAESKAKVRFRSHNGSVLTDFPADILKTTSENLGGTNWANYAGEHVKIGVQIANEVGREIAQAAREMAGEIKEAAAEVRRHKAEVEQHTKELQKESEELKKESQELEKQATDQTRTPKPARLRAPKPPRPPSIPAISGGKVVSGTLNGGGTELSVTTMNGNITLRRR